MTGTCVPAEGVETLVISSSFLIASSVVPLCLSGILPQFLHIVSIPPCLAGTSLSAEHTEPLFDSLSFSTEVCSLSLKILETPLPPEGLHVSLTYHATPLIARQSILSTKKTRVPYPGARGGPRYMRPQGGQGHTKSHKKLHKCFQHCSHDWLLGGGCRKSEVLLGAPRNRSRG